jgi:hypothetical protein
MGKRIFHYQYLASCSGWTRPSLAVIKLHAACVMPLQGLHYVESSST